MTDQAWVRQHGEVFPAAPLRLSMRALLAAEPFLEVAGIGAWVYQPDTRQLWWSRETRRIHGVGDDYRPDPKAALTFIAPEARAEAAATISAALEEGREGDAEVPIVRADGRRCQVRVRGRRSCPRGQAPLLVGTMEDVTTRHEAAQRAARELALRSRSETLLRDVIDGIPAAVSVYDADERLILVNENFRTLLPGYKAFMVPGARLADIVTRKVAAGHYAPEVRADDPPAVRAAWVADYLARHRSPGYVRLFHLAGGRWLQASAARSTSGNTVSIRTDITALKQAEAELRRIVEHDALTGLASRGVLMQRLEGLCAGRRRVDGGGGLVVLLDVDFFKAVNDSLGHAAGDLLLRLTGRRLQRLLRRGDTAARLAGDEFALIVDRAGDEAAMTALLQRLVSRLRRPMRLGATRYVPSVSVGVARFPHDGLTPRDLLAHADAALYEAKRQGRGRFAFFDAALAERVARRTRLADRLRQAVAERRVVAALQPQQRLCDGSIMGFEALARWFDDGQWVPPSEFVAIAEEIGLAQPLGTLVLDSALAGYAAMLRQGLDPGHLAVNITTAQLLADDFVDALRRLLERHGVAPRRLEVEITETVLLDRSIGRIGQTLEGLRQMGISLALDDFGTGYASLSHLTSFPVDRIKIDKGFTGAIDLASDRGLIARTLIGLGRGLRLEVVAEGVETESQRSFLVAHGCTAIQGYLVARPMLADEARLWLAQQARQRHRRTPGILRGAVRA